MSHTRLFNSDVYMYWDGLFGVIVCFNCSLNENEDKSFTKRSDAIEHLKQHMAAGDIVGGYAIPLLKKEIREIGDEVKKTR